MYRKPKYAVSGKLAAPFFVVLAVISVISFIIPLRPQVSYTEKRELARFPAFSTEALLSGSYFADITTWFSDTFPGRETWLTVSQDLASLHGYGEISIQGARPVEMSAPSAPTPPETTPTTPPAATKETEPEETAAKQPEETAETVPAETQPPEVPSEPEQTEGAAVEAGEDFLLDLAINSDSVIQMGDIVFYPVGFSEYYSDRYIKSLNRVAEKLEARGTRIINANPPTAVGIIVPDKYLESIRSTPQTDIQDYLNAGFSDKVVTVDTVNALKAHKDEYLFFHTDHHWTALAAYYSYEAVCNTLGMEPAPLDSFTEMNQGSFKGSLTGKASNPRKLGADVVYSYEPVGNITMNICSGTNYIYESEAPIIRDMREGNENEKYMAFLMGDRPMIHITNEDLPEGKNCLIIKDSFGNCFVPFFSKNYHNVYAIDYRKFTLRLAYIVEQYDIQDVIFAPNIMAVESDVGVNLIDDLCTVY